MSETDVSQPVPDVIDCNLDVLFCGINPGLTSAATHHHFARPGNRFWKALYGSGFTPTLLSPADQHTLLKLKLGITNFVSRSSATANELADREVATGANQLIDRVKKFQPKWLAVLGIDANRKGFNVKKVQIGKQPQMIGSTQVWLLPNPSGLNAHYTQKDFIDLFTELRSALLAGATTTSAAATTTTT